MRKGLTLFFVTVIFFAGINFVHAQVGSVYGSVNDVTIDSYPDNPQANQEVTLQIRSFLLNLTSADISWAIDGKKAQSGVGLIQFKFTTKDVGVPTTIDLTILPIGGYIIKKHLTITPSSIDVLWEATDSHIPPFYKGKALPTTEAQLKFVAIPNIKASTGAMVNPADMVYTWNNDYDVDKANSGYGKDTYTMKMPFVDDSENIGVTAQLRGGGYSATQQVQMSTADAKVVWYVTSPLYGPQYDKAINDGYNVSSVDLSVLAEPFYVSPKSIFNNTNLTYAWRLNGDSLDNKNGNLLSLHRNSGDQGDASVDLQVDNKDKYLQELKSSITLHLE